jgi:Fungal specific transcription factor domain
MCRNEMSRAHSVLVGTAIRLAECMGLHKDPKMTYGLGPLESHTRRTLWCQLCFLDIRTTEAQGPRPLIRRDDFDSSFPLNVNDADLVSGNPEEKGVWTDMTFSKIRFECNEMHRVIWVDRGRLEKKQVSLTHVLGKIESFRKAMEAKYHPILDENVPLQREAKLVMNLLLLRMHIMVLHRYHYSFAVRIPDRIRQIILATGTQQMEDAVRLETDPALQPWAWYCGAYQQWHTAFLLLVEIFSFPMRREADRIWRVLDYVFETDPSMTREQKARAILSALRDRTGAYRDVRKIKAPVSMLSRIYAGPSRKPGEGRAFKQPLDFNSDPTPPASRVVLSPPMAHHSSYGPAEYPTIDSAGHGNRSLSGNNNGHPSQVNNQIPFNSSYATLAPAAGALPATAELIQMTKALADAPSPVSPPDQLQDQNWTFDAPSTFFVSQSQRRKSFRNMLPGERTTQTSPPPSDATSSPGNYSNSTVQIAAGRNLTSDGWSGGIVGGDIGYSVSPPPGLITGRSPSEIVSPTSSGGGGPADVKGVLHGITSQAAGVPGMDSDMLMVDIDWVKPPKVNVSRVACLPYSFLSKPILLPLLHLLFSPCLISGSWLQQTLPATPLCLKLSLLIVTAS